MIWDNIIRDTNNRLFTNSAKEKDLIYKSERKYRGDGNSRGKR